VEINLNRINLSHKGLVSKKSVFKQRVMDFIGEHPRLVTALAGVGITFTFAYAGRFALHEAFALSSLTDIGSSVSVEHIAKVSVDSVPGHFHNVGIDLSCSGCASDVAPGHEATSPGDAKDFAPGGLAESPGDAKDFAPGTLQKNLKP
jgi:hypothetical protein